MLYLDSSALSKRYLQEKGSDELKIKLQAADRIHDPVLTSFLSFAEIHAALARKLKEQSFRVTEYHAAVTRFDSDWRTYLTRIELSQRVLAFVPDLVNRHPLKGPDAIQLASALWAASATQPRGIPESVEKSMLFVTADKQLAGAAEKEQLRVFNPELA